MKRIIDGTRYDTGKAACVDDWGNCLPQSDFGYCAEWLYRTASGNWFLHGEGGAMSPYACRSGDSTGFGETIQPMTPEEALTWLEAKGDPATIEKYFADYIQDA